MITVIVAASTNNVIGVAGELPWRPSDDLKRFKALTLGKPVVMGRKTFDSIGRPLPDRQNIIITTRPEFVAEGCDVVYSPDTALAIAGDAEEVMIIGGGEIYRLFLPVADRVHMTRVNIELDGDAHFPALNEAIWTETAREERAADEKNDYDVAFLTYCRNE